MNINGPVARRPFLQREARSDVNDRRVPFRGAPIVRSPSPSPRLRHLMDIVFHAGTRQNGPTPPPPPALTATTGAAEIDMILNLPGGVPAIPPFFLSAFNRHPQLFKWGLFKPKPRRCWG